MSEAPLPVITISSHVAAGAVGNSVITPALLALWGEPIAIPTVILFNHPGHGSPEGSEITAEVIASILARAIELGLVRSPAVFLTGYFRTPAQIEAVTGLIESAKKLGSCAYYLCDPVLGDEHTGLYVKPGI